MFIILKFTKNYYSNIFKNCIFAIIYFGLRTKKQYANEIKQFLDQAAPGRQRKQNGVTRTRKLCMVQKKVF